VVTEALQKEVVKRLLYSAKPSRLPRSQLNRIRPFLGRRTLLTSAIGSIAYLAAEWVYSIPGPAIKWASSWPMPPSGIPSVVWVAMAHLTDALIAFGLLVAIQWALSLIRIREVSVGEFKLAKEDAAQNPFDQYLDEIVYFFASTGKRVVLFEDLDRFKDRGIFVALRELNILLNNSDAVHQAVTFVYAAGDKVFAPRKNHPGARGASGPSSDRAKFFDLIVPVVPFVSTETAAGLLARQLRQLHNAVMPEDALIRLVGSYFPDMRAIISLRNEYQVFFDRLIVHGKLRLDESKLFAMVAYKHAFPKDFDAIQFGSSKLEAALELIDTLTSRRLSGLDQDIRAIESDIEQRDGQALRAESAGKNFLDVLGILVPPGRAAIAQVSIAGSSFSTADTASLEFWEAIDEAPTDDLTVTFANGASVVVQRAALAKALPSDLPASSWLASSKSNLEVRLARLTSTKRVLAHANLAERIGNPAFVGLGPSPDGQTLVTVDFRSSVAELMQSDFAVDLIASGYLDETYVLYASVYEDSLVTVEAQNFRIQFVARRRSSPQFLLSREDVAAIRAKAGDSFLDEPSGLNVSIFNYLLEGKDLDSAIVLIADERLDGHREFVATYLSEGDHPDLLVAKLAPRARWILSFIAASEVTPATAQDAFDAALASLSPDIDYEINEACGPFLIESATSALGGRGANARQLAADAVARVYADNGVRATNLRDWSKPARDALSKAGAFEMTRDNIAAMTGNRNSLGLDSIGRGGVLVLHQVLSRVAEYIDVLEAARRPSIDSDEDLDALLRVVASAGMSELRAIVSHAPRDFAIEDLREYDPDLSDELVASYPILAESDFFDPTAVNVARYLTARGSVDVELEDFLARNPVLDEKDLSIDERSAIARSLAAARSLGVEKLASVLRSLEIGAIDARGLRIGRPDVARMLVRDKYLTVDDATWSALAKSDWGVKEAVLAAASREDLSDLPLTADDLELALTSRALPLELKVAVVEDPSQFPHISTPKGATAAIGIAREAHITLSSDQLISLVGAGATPTSVIDYLASSASSSDDRDLSAVLLAMGGDWAALVDGSSRWKYYDWSASLQLLLERLQKSGHVSKATLQGKKIRVTFAA